MASKASIFSLGAYVPRQRIARSTIADLWGAPAIGGERALAGTDEDALTLGVEAARNCLEGFDRFTIDGVFFASTTSPYAEHQAATIIAAALDLREDIATLDVAGSLRAGTSALRSAHDAVASGAQDRVLVIVSDNRPAEPETAYEQFYGDGAVALLVGAKADGSILDIEAFQSVAEDVTVGWRRAEDPYVRSYNPKHELEYGFAAPLANVLSTLIDELGIQTDKARLAIASPDGRSHRLVAKKLSIPPGSVADAQVPMVGVLGTAAPFLALMDAVEHASGGDSILLGSAGEGADGVVLTHSGMPQSDSKSLSRILVGGRSTDSYGDLIRAKGLIKLSVPEVPSSPVQYWRDRKQFLNLRGMRCTGCGLVQYPIGRICHRCKAQDSSEEVALRRRGRVFTYTGDHIVASTYSTKPVVRAIVDLDDGGRILTSLTDCDLEDVQVGIQVELVFRRTNDGGNFVNYYWKARPSVPSSFEEQPA